MSSPRIIFFDLETLPNLRMAMKFWPQLSNYPGLTLRAQINSVACFGFKVLGEETECLCLWDYEVWDTDLNDDRCLVEAAYEILESADAVVTHNGKSFDWKFLQTRILIHGLKPLPKIPHIDTKQLMKSNLTMFNNKLVTAAEALTSTSKMDHGLGWELWERVSQRDVEACEIMRAYCMQDVVALEELFKRLRPFATNIPNYNLFSPGGEKMCPSCGSTRLHSDGLRSNATMTYRRLHCVDCGSRMKEPLNKNIPRAF